MKRLFLSAALLLGIATVSQAAGECVIMGTDSREMRVDDIKALPNGDLEYVTGASKIRSRISKSKYKWASVPKPKDIVEAESLFKAGDFKKAAAIFKKAADSYKFLGWGVYSLNMQGESLAKLGDKDDAIKCMSDLKSYKPETPEVERDLMNAYKTLSNLYIETGDPSSAPSLLDTLSKYKDDNLAAFSLNKKGDIAAKQGKKMDAVTMYAQTDILFPKSSERPEALFKIVGLLNEMKDSRSAKFSEKLKSEYPESPFTKQLK